MSGTGEHHLEGNSPSTAVPDASFASSLITPSVFFPNMTAAIILATMNIAIALAIAALVFSGPLVPYQSMGTGLFLLATAIGGVLVPAFSGYKAIVAGPRSGQAPLFAAMAASVALIMGDAPVENIAVTVVVTILVTTILIGLVMFVIGLAKIGAIARYIPYPVMGGTFAGLGYLLTKGGILLSVGSAAEVTHPAQLLQTETLLYLLPAVGLAVLLLTAERVFNHWLVLPAILALSIVAFYGVLFGLGGTVADAIANNWLPQPVRETAYLPILVPSQLALVDWYAVLAQSGTIAVLALLSVLMLLLDVSGVEILINKDLDHNHELKAAGLVNIIGGFLFAPLTFQATSDTTLTYKLGGTRFLMILIYGAIIAAVIAFGPALISYAPPILLGGILIYVGLGFLIHWVWNARKKLPLSDMLVILCILYVVASFGILEGVAAGIGLATVLFVHRYSQLSIIKARISGSEYASNIDRSREDQAILDRHSAAVEIIVLQGFLFFGSASRLLDQVKHLLSVPERATLSYLVMDFHHVDAMDTSAANSFAKLMQLAQRERLTLVLTGCAPDVSERLTLIAHDLGLTNDVVHFFASLDAGVGWCDDTRLASVSTSDTARDSALDQGFEHMLTDLLGQNYAAMRLAPFFERIEKPAGAALFAQDDPGDTLYLILKGSISIVLALPEGASLTVRTMRAGALLGEMALYTGAPRSASAIAKQDCVLYSLDRSAFDTLQANHPHSFGLFHSFVVRLMAERVNRANRSILALSR